MEIALITSGSGRGISCAGHVKNKTRIRAHKELSRVHWVLNQTVSLNAQCSVAKIYMLTKKESYCTVHVYVYRCDNSNVRVVTTRAYWLIVRMES